MGDFATPAGESQPCGTPEPVRVHDFPGDAVGKAIPYGVYDMARNEASVSVGRDHDTPAFAVASIRPVVDDDGTPGLPARDGPLHHGRCGRQQWLSLPGLETPAAGPRRRPRAHHPRLALPPGTNKWNKIEYRLFCHITHNWRPLRTLETVVALIGHTRSAAGLRVKATLDTRRYAPGETVTNAQMRSLALSPDVFHRDWNYELRPRSSC